MAGISGRSLQDVATGLNQLQPFSDVLPLTQVSNFLGECLREAVLSLGHGEHRVARLWLEYMGPGYKLQVPASLQPSVIR